MPIHADEHVSVEEALSREVIRKLKLAAEAETKDDREIICEELFCDITGHIDSHAQERLGLPSGDAVASASHATLNSSHAASSPSKGFGRSSPTKKKHGSAAAAMATAAAGAAQSRPMFYEVLARFYQNARDSGEAVSHLCQRLWGQGYAAPIFALLLHRWLLLGRGAAAQQKSSSTQDLEPAGDELPIARKSSGWRGLGYTLSKTTSQQPAAPPVAVPAQPLQQPHRIKQVSVLVLGARQLFLGDVHSGQTRFVALYRCLMEEVIMGPGIALLSRLPLGTRSDLLSAVAAVLPYYSAPAAMHDLIASLPPPSATVQPQEQLAGALQGGKSVPRSAGGLVWSSSPGAGADFLLSEVADTLGKIRSEAGLLRYLAALQALKGSPHLRTLQAVTSLRLQSELYSLTSPGGPHYAPRAVRVAAMKTLDAMYPMGRRTRRVVRLIFRLLHPTDWLGEFWLAPFHWWAWLYTTVLLAALRFFASLLWSKPNTDRGSRRR